MAGPCDIPDAAIIINEPCVCKASHKWWLAEAPSNTINKQNWTTNALVDSTIVVVLVNKLYSLEVVH